MPSRKLSSIVNALTNRETGAPGFTTLTYAQMLTLAVQQFGDLCLTSDTKQYYFWDGTSWVAFESGSTSASDVTYAPTSPFVSTNVQDALDEIPGWLSGDVNYPDNIVLQTDKHISLTSGPSKHFFITDGAGSMLSMDGSGNVSLTSLGTFPNQLMMTASGDIFLESNSGDGIQMPGDGGGNISEFYLSLDGGATTIDVIGGNFFLLGSGGTSSYVNFSDMYLQGITSIHGPQSGTGNLVIDNNLASAVSSLALNYQSPGNGLIQLFTPNLELDLNDGANSFIFSGGVGTTVDMTSMKMFGFVNVNAVLPTSPSGLVSGDWYTNSGVVTVVP